MLSAELHVWVAHEKPHDKIIAAVVVVLVVAAKDKNYKLIPILKLVPYLSIYSHTN